MPDRLGVSATGFEALGIGVRFCPTRVVRSNAVTGVKDLLHANPEVKVVYAHKDHMTLGALRVPCEADRTDVKVAGVDGLGEALKAMWSSEQFTRTALNGPRYLGDMKLKWRRPPRPAIRSRPASA